MTTEQLDNIREKNFTLFNAYDAIVKAAETNETTFEDMLTHMETLHTMKTRIAQRNQLNNNKN